MKAWLAAVWRDIRRPLGVIAGHLAVTLAAIIAVAVVEEVLVLTSLGKKKVPFLDLTLAEWLYDLDAVSVSAIIGIGIIKGVRLLWKS